MTHLDYHWPFYLWVGISKLFCQHISCLSYYLNILYYSIIQYRIFLKLLIRHTIKETGNPVNSLLNVHNTACISQCFSHLS